MQDFPVVIQLTLVFQACQSYLAFLSMYQTEFPREDMSSHKALAQARKRITTWIVAAMVTDLSDKERDKPETGRER
jgi:phenylalanine-4-hydroxylase